MPCFKNNKLKIKLENHNTKEIKKKLDGLDKKIKPEPTDL